MQVVKVCPARVSAVRVTLPPAAGFWLLDACSLLRVAFFLVPSSLVLLVDLLRSCLDDVRLEVSLQVSVDRVLP